MRKQLVMRVLQQQCRLTRHLFPEVVITSCYHKLLSQVAYEQSDLAYHGFSKCCF
jgi:hypothetical protein